MLQVVDHALNDHCGLILFHLKRRTLQEDHDTVTLVEHLHRQLVIQLGDLVDELECQVD